MGVCPMSMPPPHTHSIDNDNNIDTNDCYGDNDDYDDEDDGVLKNDGNNDKLMGVCPMSMPPPHTHPFEDDIDNAHGFYV